MKSNMLINGNKIREDQIGYWIGQCLNFETLKDKFVGIHEVLAELGFKRVEVIFNYCTEDMIEINVDLTSLPYRFLILL